MKSKVSVFHLYSLTELASDRKYLIRGKHMFKCQYWFQTVEHLKITCMNVRVLCICTTNTYPMLFFTNPWWALLRILNPKVVMQSVFPPS